ncbi:hypothetical protein PPTG_24237 [Phytophthora nicotianae INRA-310]|uniref:SNF2 N-terminal domain-containing protein n=2 Tax=Phytophthora nicotianae TaxID=4792 RepID=W2PHV4_PHYN3|nr:hypothetical protein PPTG_24237 [Phytophthora nicotianae INRA-310]ETN00603.1 hypothetical protein PPTG_24237 [Phytophthora nicotianae INRA-310]
MDSLVPLKVELLEPTPNRGLNLLDVYRCSTARIQAARPDLHSEDVTGLKFKLFEHQRRGLSWMNKRERDVLWDTLLLHPFSVPDIDCESDRMKRVVVDEGHTLGSGTTTQLMEMTRLLCAERRWVMAGTPSPNTFRSADLQYLHGILTFLRVQPYGQPVVRAWAKAIVRPFQKEEVAAFIGFYTCSPVL